MNRHDNPEFFEAYAQMFRSQYGLGSGGMAPTAVAVSGTEWKSGAGFGLWLRLAL